MHQFDSHFAHLDPRGQGEPAQEQLLGRVQDPVYLGRILGDELGGLVAMGGEVELQWVVLLFQAGEDVLVKVGIHDVAHDCHLLPDGVHFIRELIA